MSHVVLRRFILKDKTEARKLFQTANGRWGHGKPYSWGSGLLWALISLLPMQRTGIFPAPLLVQECKQQWVLLHAEQDWTRHGNFQTREISWFLFKPLFPNSFFKASSLPGVAAGLTSAKSLHHYPRCEFVPLSLIKAPVCSPWISHPVQASNYVVQLVVSFLLSF